MPPRESVRARAGTRSPAGAAPQDQAGLLFDERSEEFRPAPAGTRRRAPAGGPRAADRVGASVARPPRSHGPLDPTRYTRPAVTPDARSPWLFSRRADLLLFGGPALVSVLLLFWGARTGDLNGDLPSRSGS